MKEYQYLVLRYMVLGVMVECTNRQTLDWIVNTTKERTPTRRKDPEIYTVNKLIPDFDTEETKIFSQIHWARLPGVQEQSMDTYNWLHEQICAKGWEPIKVDEVAVRIHYTSSE